MVGLALVACVVGLGQRTSPPPPSNPPPYAPTEVVRQLVAKAQQQWPDRPRPECDPSGDVRISESAVLAEQSRANWTRLLRICCHSRPLLDAEAKKYLYRPRREHYALLAHLSRRLGERGGGLLVELGTREGASAVALGNDPRNTLYSFDLVNSQGHVRATMQSRMPPGSKADVQAAAPNVHFVRANLTAIGDGHSAWRRIVTSASILLLDTHHRPESVPFEYGFVQMLRTRGFGGLLILDDILLNPEMKRFWFWIRSTFQDRAVDLTHIGHGSGTGMVNFCGAVNLTA
eukprot:TRINITY_DN2030_c0_g1_i1.p1 TRINITY_DN2030_c0_g1~~TRINITY_DN2030_c0_g1_i1.p1  ORF type:complete len:328 (+),score=61.46 TRINITY_DN2030_c0_g1_i1:119-985(+)